MASDWQDLTKLTQGAPIMIERVRLTGKGIAIEGQFDLPPLAQLTMEDQVFVAAFVCSHGSIKQMERTFGVSYPTIKNRLNRIAATLDFVHVEVRPDRGAILDRLERGEITAKQAAEELRR